MKTAAQQVDEIIAAATTVDEPIASLLRRCLVLERKIHSRRFKTWLDKELDGYGKNDRLPEYRRHYAHSQGLVLGYANQSNNQPLNIYVMEARDRALIDHLELRQPAAAYDGRKGAGDAQIPWPAPLTAKYQDKFFRGGMVNRAWQLLPGSHIVGLLDVIRTRILRFALDLQQQLDEVDEDPSRLPPEKVEKIVVNQIFSGVVNFGTVNGDMIQAGGDITINKSDTKALVEAVLSLGFTRTDVDALTTALEADAKHGEPTFGTKAKGWIAKVGTTFGKTTLAVSADVAKTMLVEWIKQYTGQQ